MKKVALIYSKNISDLTGVSAVMRSFAENKDLFKKNGIELSVYSRENICNKSQILKEARRSNNLKQRIKSKISQFITKHAKKHSLFAFLKIYIASIRPAKKIVQYFVNQNKKYDIIFIHEIFTCYEYLKQWLKSKISDLCHYQNFYEFPKFRIKLLILILLHFNIVRIIY